MQFSFTGFLILSSGEPPRPLARLTSLSSGALYMELQEEVEASGPTRVSTPLNLLSENMLVKNCHQISGVIAV